MFKFLKKFFKDGFDTSEVGLCTMTACLKQNV